MSEHIKIPFGHLGNGKESRLVIVSWLIAVFKKLNCSDANLALGERMTWKRPCQSKIKLDYWDIPYLKGWNVNVYATLKDLVMSNTQDCEIKTCVVCCQISCGPITWLLGLKRFFPYSINVCRIWKISCFTLSKLLRFKRLSHVGRSLVFHISRLLSAGLS